MKEEQDVVIDDLEDVENIQQKVGKLLETIPENNLKELKSNNMFQNKDVESVIADYKWQLYDKIVNVYNQRIASDEKIKKKYSVALIVILIIQLIVLDSIFFFQGFGLMKLSDTTLNIFITATIAEIFTLVHIIVKYLFTDKLTNLLTKILADENFEEKKNPINQKR